MTPAEEAKYDYGYICGTQDASYGRDLSPAVPGERVPMSTGHGHNSLRNAIRAGKVPPGPGMEASIRKWHYYAGGKHWRSVELVSMQLTSAIVRYPGGEPFVIGRTAIGRGWLR